MPARSTTNAGNPRMEPASKKSGCGPDARALNPEANAFGVRGKSGSARGDQRTQWGHERANVHRLRGA